MALACFKCRRSVHLYDAITNKYGYLKQRGTITMEYDADIESYILRIFLDSFLKETIEIQPVPQRPDSVSFLNDSGYDSENFDNSSIGII